MTSPLLRSHVTVGAGSPFTIALKNAFFPKKKKKKKENKEYHTAKLQLYKLVYNIVVLPILFPRFVIYHFERSHSLASE